MMRGGLWFLHLVKSEFEIFVSGGGCRIYSIYECIQVLVGVHGQTVTSRGIACFCKAKLYGVFRMTSGEAKVL